jgi:hypothetical protein
VNDGGPAFPEPIVSTPDHGLQSSGSYGFQTGMSLRDYFAAMSMMGQCANPDCEPEDVTHNAIVSYRNADAMLAAREVKS